MPGTSTVLKIILSAQQKCKNLLLFFLYQVKPLEAPNVLVIIVPFVMAVADVKAVFQDDNRTVLIAVVRQQRLADDAN